MQRVKTKAKFKSHSSLLKTKTQNNGITLIALVVTIVVLLILAGITITALFGENGLITRAKIADQKTKEGAQNDIDAIENLSQQANNLVNGNKEVAEPTDIYVTLYTDGTLAFSNNTEKMQGKEVQKEYGNIKDQTFTANRQPWVGYRDNILNVIFINKIVPTNTAYWFQDYKNITEITNINNLNTSRVTDMSGMFWSCSGLSSLDVSKFDTSKATNMSYMFLVVMDYQI